MGKPNKSQESVIAELKIRHNNFYSYNNFIYKGVSEKSLVTCPEHGDFLINVNSHMNGSGCKSCYSERRGSIRRLTKDQFVEKAMYVHGEKYNYSKVYYVTQNFPVIIECPIHGDFEQKPVNHMIGRGCRECKKDKLSSDRRKSLEEVVQQAKEVHENRYTYELCTEYKNQKTRWKINCPIHGIFEMNVTNHLCGKGCAACSTFGYKQTSPAYIYILQCDDLVKIGVCNNKPSLRRLKDIRKSSGKDFTIYDAFYHENGAKVYCTEQQALKHFSKLYEQPREIFSGSTECFYDLNPETAKQYIAELLQSN